jgi:hypothetical protein
MLTIKLLFPKILRRGSMVRDINPSNPDKRIECVRDLHFTIRSQEHMQARCTMPLICSYLGLALYS